MNIQEIKYFKEFERLENQTKLNDKYFKYFEIPQGKEKDIDELTIHYNLGYIGFNYKETILDKRDIFICLCIGRADDNKTEINLLEMYSYNIEVINMATNYFKNKYPFLIERPIEHRKSECNSLWDERIKRYYYNEYIYRFKNVNIEFSSNIYGNDIYISGKLADQDPELFSTLQCGKHVNECNYLSYEIEKLEGYKLENGIYRRCVTNIHIRLFGEGQEKIGRNCPDCGKEYELIVEKYDTEDSKNFPTLKNFRPGLLRQRFLYLYYRKCECGMSYDTWGSAMS